MLQSRGFVAGCCMCCSLGICPRLLHVLQAGDMMQMQTGAYLVDRRMCCRLGDVLQAAGRIVDWIIYNRLGDTLQAAGSFACWGYVADYWICCWRRNML